MRKYFIDPPSGWRHGFPAAVSEEVYNNKEKLAEFILSKGYPKKDLEFALSYLRVWQEDDTVKEDKPLLGENHED